METSLENLYMHVAARQKLTAKAYSVSKDLPSSLIDIRDFNDANGNENVKKTIGLKRKITTSQVHHAFLYISFLFLYDYD